MITTLCALYPLLGPQGSRSVCLGTFSLAAFGWTGWGFTTHKTLSREWGQRKWVIWKDATSSKGSRCSRLHGGGVAWWDSKALKEVLAECMSRKCPTSWGTGNPALTLVSRKLHSVGNRKIHLHKVVEKNHCFYNTLGLALLRRQLLMSHKKNYLYNLLCMAEKLQCVFKRTVSTLQKHCLSWSPLTE